MDRFGRVVIPKEVRTRLGLRTGAALEVEEREQDILLRPVREEPRLLLKHGVLVCSGTASGTLTEAVRTHREARLSHLARRLR